MWLIIIDKWLINNGLIVLGNIVYILKIYRLKLVDVFFSWFYLYEKVKVWKFGCFFSIEEIKYLIVVFRVNYCFCLL